MLQRLQKEIIQLEQEPPPGVTAWPIGDKLDELEAVIQGPKDTPYEGGSFKLSISVTERYPFEPPKVKFITRIYHPNIDDGGRICLELLKMPPHGKWTPSQNLSILLSSIHVLLSFPNPDDPLMAEIAEEYKHDRQKYEATAREWTKKYATESALPRTASPSSKHPTSTPVPAATTTSSSVKATPTTELPPVTTEAKSKDQPTTTKKAAISLSSSDEESSSSESGEDEEESNVNAALPHIPSTSAPTYAPTLSSSKKRKDPPDTSLPLDSKRTKR